MAFASEDPIKRLIRRLIWVSTVMVGVGIAALLVYPIRPEIGAGLLTALAALTVGSQLGFLFGIPRSPQDERVDAAAYTAASTRFGVNSNLEQISDWLTKILVGIGLVQIGAIGPQLGRLIDVVAQSFGAATSGRVAAGGLLVGFTVLGFMIGYVVTRTSLHRLFESFAGDLASYVQQQAEESVQRALPAAIAASVTALEVAISHLDASHPPVDRERLAKAITSASHATLDAIYAATGHTRRDVPTPQTASRAADVLGLLTRARPERHQYWAELGKTLARTEPPDYGQAATALSRAISLRSPDSSAEYRLYRTEMLAALHPSPDEATRELIQGTFATRWMTQRSGPASRRHSTTQLSATQSESAA